MVKVDSRETVNTLSRRFMRANRGRNIIAIVAIVMTTVMFTSLFTAALSVIKSNQQQEIRSCMDASHVTVQDMTKEQFDAVRKYEGADKSGYTIFMATGDNKELATSQTEIRYADNNAAESFISKPATGRMPKKYDEIAMSTITLDLLGVPHKIGSKVTLDFTTKGEKQSDTFVLSGYWKGDPFFMAQLAWVSEDYCLSHCMEATEKAISLDEFEGSYSFLFWGKNVLRLQDYAEEISSRYNLAATEAKVSVNPAYDFFEEDAFPFGTVAVLLLIIFISGYLIIYNVFRISVSSDIRAYGLLKNVGTTGRQLKKIVRRQALYMSAVGIPTGLVVGYLVGCMMTPFLLADIGASGSDKMEVLLSVNPVIFAAAALFSLMTVYTGCLRPCHIVASVSPVEAVRMTDRAGEGAGKKSAEVKYKDAGMKTGRVTPVGMAFGNVRSSWKKALIVVISLALPIMVLNGVFTVVKSFDFNMYVSSYISNDFNVSGCAANLGASNMKAISPEFVKAVYKQKQLDSAAIVYDNGMTYELDDKGYENLKEMITLAGEKGIITGEGLKREEAMAESREVPAHLLGINKQAFDKLEFQNESCSWREFSTGEYVIVGRQVKNLGNFYEAGDVISLKTEEGAPCDYKVISIADEPYDLGYPFGSGTWFDYMFYIPQSQYLAAGGNENAMKMGIDVKKGTEKEFSKWLTSYIDKSEMSIYVNSRMDIKKQCDGFVAKYYIVLGLLCSVLFIIGILNFYNTSSVSIMTRRRELALLEAIGMTKKQLNRMLIAEGLSYLLAAIIIADTAGLLLARLIIRNTVGQMFFFTYQMSILPSLLALPLLVAVAVAVPLKNYRDICSRTVVERVMTR